MPYQRCHWLCLPCSWAPVSSKTSTPKRPLHASDAKVQLDELETYDSLEPDITKRAKIHKVLTAIISLKSTPHEQKYDYKRRFQALLDEWDITRQINRAAAATNTTKHNLGEKQEATVDDSPAEVQGATVAADSRHTAASLAFIDQVEKEQFDRRGPEDAHLPAPLDRLRARISSVNAAAPPVSHPEVPPSSGLKRPEQGLNDILAMAGHDPEEQTDVAEHQTDRVREMFESTG